MDFVLLLLEGVPLKTICRSSGRSSMPTIHGTFDTARSAPEWPVQKFLLLSWGEEMSVRKEDHPEEQQQRSTQRSEDIIRHKIPAYA